MSWVGPPTQSTGALITAARWNQDVVANPAWLYGGTQSITSTGTVNDVAAVLGRYSLLRCNNASLLTITGFAAGTDGDIIDVVSVGAGQVDFAHQNAGSSAANRLINCATSGNTSLAAGVGTARFVYDTTTARWRLKDHDQGAWIAVTFNAADFTASGAMTWTVDSGDISAHRYWLKGRTLFIQFNANTMTFGGTTNNTLSIKIPGGFSTGAAAYMPLITLSPDGAAYFTARPAVGAAATVVTFTKIDAANIALGTNSALLWGSYSFEVS